MDINELVARLRVINSLMVYLPGSGGYPGYDQELKVLFYQMMPSDWKLAYLKTACPIINPTFTCLDMAHYMRIHESAAAAISRQQVQRQSQGNRGGRPNTGGNNRSGNVCGGRRGRGNQDGGDGGCNVRRCGNDGTVMCPFPGHNHPWAQCFANLHGTNYVTEEMHTEIAFVEMGIWWKRTRTKLRVWV